MFFSAFDWNHNELQFFFFFSSSLCLNLNKSPTNFVLPQVKSCSSLPAAQRGNKLPHNVRHEYKTYLRSESKQLRPFDNSSADSGFVCRPLQASLFVHRRVPDLFVDTARVLGMSRTSETCRRWVVCHLDPCGRADVESIIQASSCTAEKVTNVSFPELWDRIVHSVQVRSLRRGSVWNSNLIPRVHVIGLICYQMACLFFSPLDLGLGLTLINVIKRRPWELVIRNFLFCIRNISFTLFFSLCSLSHSFHSTHSS